MSEKKKGMSLAQRWAEDSAPFNFIDEEKTEKAFTIYKADEDRRLVFGWASIAITVDGEVLEDRQGDMIDPEELEYAAYEYVLYFRDTGEEHLPGYRKKGKLVESVVLTEEKQRAMGIPEGILPVGWWLGFYIEDDDAWERVKNGTYKMFSIEGHAQREEVVKSHKPGCGVLVIEDGKILTGTRIEEASKGQICGPGGHIEPGETTEDAAIREAYEEFGIICRDLRPLGALDADTPAVFLCTEYTGEPRVDEEELTNLQWRTLEELQQENLFAPFRDSLELLPKRRARLFNEIVKFNPYHGPDGKFTTANAASSFTYAPGKSRAHDLAIEREKQRQASAGTSEESSTTEPKKITDTEAMDLRKQMGQAPDQLDSRTRNAMAGYIGSSESFEINEALNEGRVTIGPAEKRTIEALDSNMRELPRGIKVYRKAGVEELETSLGIDLADGERKLGASELQSLEGRVVERRSFTSTGYSLDNGCFNGRPVTLNLNVPKGSPALFSPFDNSGGDKIEESEVVLPRNTAYKIIKVRQEENAWGSWDTIVDADVLLFD